MRAIEEASRARSRLFMRFCGDQARSEPVINLTRAEPQLTVQQRLRRRWRPNRRFLASHGIDELGLFRSFRNSSGNSIGAHTSNTRDFISATPTRPRVFAQHLGERAAQFEFECYDVGHLYNLAHFVDRGLVKPPMLIQTIYGIFGGIGPEAENLMHMRRMADHLFGDQYHWSILGAGRHQMGLITMGAIMGGHCRVGLEDSIYLKKGQLAKSNAEQVTKIRTILNELSLEIATPDEARKMLACKGKDNVGF